MKLVLIDTSGIQRFIFGSNRLRENVGASFLVAVATREWIFSNLLQPNNLIRNGGKLSIGSEKCIETDQKLNSEVVYAAGGNAVILFRHEGDANEFIRMYSKHILFNSPGLSVQIIARDFDWNAKPNGLYREVQEGLKQLNEEKRAQSPSQPLLGLSVTRACQSTGLPAVGTVDLSRGNNQGKYDVSREVQTKHRVRDEANARLELLINPGNGFQYPDELDDIGRSVGEFSYIAVVHIDGNGMGQRVRRIGCESTNRDYITLIRKFSEALNAASLKALNATVQFLIQSIDTPEGKIVDRDFPGARGRQILLKRGHEFWFLPIRPIIYGGDDVTFVCDGRIAMSLALEYMKHFVLATSDLPDGDGGAQSSGGIAIVKSHYPFARAYELSEQLCASAKRLVRTSGVSASAIDWHFANAGLAGDLDEIRGRELVVPEGNLNLRPVFVSGGQAGLHTWARINQGIEAFRGKNWAGRRNKVKALREALREGCRDTHQFCDKYSLKLPDLGLENSNYQSNGWLHDSLQQDRKCCVYFDAIELADFNIPLTV